MGKELTIKRVTLFLVVSAILISNVFAYPVIVSEKGVNHTQVKELVYSIPEVYYEGVDVIEFVNEPIQKWIKIEENHWTLEYFGGWYRTYWDREHNCFDGKIWIYNFDLLVHELGHNYEYCILKKDISTEEFADDFEIR